MIPVARPRYSSLRWTPSYRPPLSWGVLFANAARPESNFEYWKSSVFHFCIQDPDVEGLAARIVAAGGKQRMPVREYFPGQKPYRMVYMEDPFGNILEIYSHSYELTYSAGAYGQTQG